MGFLYLSYANARSITIHHNILSYSNSPSQTFHYFHRSISKSRGFTNRRPRNFKLQLVQQQHHCFLHLVALPNVNAVQSGGERSNVNDPNNHTEGWEYIKQFHWEDLVLPAGFGIVVAVPAARQRATVFFLLSLFIYLLVHKASALQRGQLISRTTVSFKSLRSMFNTPKKFIASRGLLLLVGLIAVLRKIQVYVNKFVAGAENSLISIRRERFSAGKQLNGLPSDTLPHSITVQQWNGNRFQKDMQPSNSLNSSDSSPRAKFARKPDHVDDVLADAKICISKMENMMAKEQSFLKLSDMIHNEVRKTLDLLKVLSTALSLIGDRHDLSQLQIDMTKENFKTKSVGLAHFDSDQLCESVDAAENIRHEILKVISKMKDRGQGENVNISASSKSESTIPSLNAQDSLSISCGEKVIEGIDELTKAKELSAENILTQELVAGDASVCQEVQGKDFLNSLTDRGAVLDSNNELMFQSNPCQENSSSSVGLLQSNLDSSSWKVNRDQINGSIKNRVVPATVTNQSNALRTEAQLSKHSQDAQDLHGLFDQDELEIAFHSSTGALIMSPRDLTERSIEECTRSNSSSEHTIAVHNQVQRGLDSQEHLVDRKLGPEEQQIGKDVFESVKSVSVGSFKEAGDIEEASKGRKNNEISEHQQAVRRRSRVKRHQLPRKDVLEIDSSKGDSMNYVEYLDDDMRSIVKASGGRDGRKSYKKVEITKNNENELEVEQRALERTGQRSVTDKILQKVSQTGLTGQQISEQTSGDSEKSLFKEEDESFWSESIKKTNILLNDQDLPHRKGLFSRKQKEEQQRLMDEGEAFFTKGKAGLSGKIEVGVAETMLYKAVDLFASAAAIDPCSIEAVGLWGNTLLVHGELKLKVSRELRVMLPSADSPKVSMKDETELLNTQQTLQVVCEECEGLLVEAGRKYRRALSINKSDIRALYNWGLALCFRAQLIAEGGGQSAAEDADKVYIAAIDKFEAMMGISQRYAPGAMLNWGLALRDRSRLHPVGSRDRIQLLQQAKQLFQDALQLSGDDAQIRGAFATCSVELKEMQAIEAIQSRKRWQP